MKVKIKKLNALAVIPSKAHATDAGMDLVATSKELDEFGNIVYGTGLAIEIPEGYVGLIFPRSSNSKKSLLLSNSVGVIDSGYRGEIMCKFKGSLLRIKPEDDEKIIECLKIAGKSAGYTFEVGCYDIQIGDKIITTEVLDYEVGDRIAQLIIMPYPQIEFEEVQELTETERGEGGYGSTGK